MTDPVIRESRPDEYDDVARLLLRAYTSSYANTAEYLDSLRHVAEVVPRQQIWVALDAGRLVGAVLIPAPGVEPAPITGEDGVLHPAPADELEFNKLAVDPDARHGGVAKALVAKAVDIARERGIARIGIHSGPQMTAAHELYERLGFRRRPERETLVVDGGQRLRVYTYDIPGGEVPDLPNPADVNTRPRGEVGESIFRREQTDDGSFKRQPNRFTARFSTGELPVEAGRYRLVISAECGWSRRQIIVRRLLGLQDAISIAYVSGRGADGGWVFADQPGGKDAVLGIAGLNEAYHTADPDYDGRGTVPSLVDTQTGKVVTNDYHVLSLELETAWKPFHGEDAPELYPEDLRPRIDLLNQQLFDDVNNGPYKVLFATRPEAAEAARQVFEARLRDLDHRLTSRRFLFGERLTDSDIRLFSTLASFDQTYVTGYPEQLRDRALRVHELPHLWAYMRDLFQTPGFVDERDTEALGITPRADGSYLGGFGEPVLAADDPGRLASWQQPAGREQLTGSAVTAGPGGAGTDTLWTFAS